MVDGKIWSFLKVKMGTLKRLGLLVPMRYEQYLDAATLFSSAFPPLFAVFLDKRENPVVKYIAALANVAYAARAFLLNVRIPISLDCMRYDSLEDKARAALNWLRQLREKDAAAAAILADMAVLYTYDVEFALEILENLLKEEKEELRCVRQRVARARKTLVDALRELTTG